jgi:hypothetical protein
VLSRPSPLADPESAVILQLQHAFEMLLKAALVEKNVPVFDRRLGRSVGFEKCVAISAEKLKLAELRAVHAWTYAQPLISSLIGYPTGSELSQPL